MVSARLAHTQKQVLKLKLEAGIPIFDPLYDTTGPHGPLSADRDGVASCGFIKRNVQ